MATKKTLEFENIPIDNNDFFIKNVPKDIVDAMAEFIYPSIQNTLKKRIQTNKNGRQHHATCQNYFLIGK